MANSPSHSELPTLPAQDGRSWSIPPPLPRTTHDVSVGPLTTLDSLALTDRYELGEEIARGGMGAVHRCRDRQLGRELAVKVLLPEHADRPEVIHRFVEEAQVGGQLQHPGIVPVHELGRLPDGRPFFAMKLIKGRTLADLLARRQSPADDLPRLLKIFEQVCQTLAYAHTHRVIHRDLKPANVMVGAFGEVQVMDWGLAKVMTAAAGPDDNRPQVSPESVVATGRSSDPGGQTVAGVVMGTYAYMPPEQARGQTDRLDERCDVFGLGGILCEMLTGKPPYTAATAEEVGYQALAANLAPAWERLARCDADGELVALARRCLAAEPGQRPADAGEVAAVVTSYLAGVAERLRAAEIESAAARVRAQAERGKRRLTVALAGTVLAVVVAAGGLWFWLNQQHRARLEQTAQQANQALGKALTLRGQAAGVALTDLARWREAESLRRDAVTAGEQAEQIVSAGEADPDTRRAVEELLPQLRAEADSTARDRAMLERLHAIRFVANDAVTDDDFDRYVALRGNDDRFIYSQVAGASEYVRAFRDYGIALEDQTADRAAALIAESHIKAELVDALDDWLRLTDAGPGRDRLLSVARLVDPDPVRDRLRLALSRGDAAALETLAASDEALRLPVSSVLLLAEGLFQKKKVTQAITLLRQAQRRHAGDFWLNNNLGEYLMFTGGDAAPQTEEAMRFFTAALVTRPQSVTARVNLADALAYVGAYEEAEAAYRQALEDQPTLAYVRNKLAATLAVNGRHDDALAESRRAVELRPGSAFIHEGHGGVCYMTGRYEEAVAAFRKAIELRPEVGSYHSGLGQALTEIGQSGAALKAHEEAVRLKPTAQTYSYLANTLVKRGELAEATEAAGAALRLQPGSAVARSSLAGALAAAGRNAEAVELFRETLALTPHDGGLWWRLGSALRSQGKMEEAAYSIREAIRRGPRQGPRLAGMYNDLGLVLSDLGQHDKAAEAFRKAADLKPDDVIIRENLGDCLRDQGLLKEAVDAFREAVRLQPTWTRPRNSLVDVLDRLDRVEEAEAVLKEAGPDDAEALYRLVRLRQDRGRHTAALALLEGWLARKPGDGVAHHLRGRSLEKTGRLDEALAAYETALTGPASARLDAAQAGSDFAAMLLDRGRRLDQEGRHDEARNATARGHAYLAWSLNKRGNTAAAADEMAVAVRLQPDDPKYQRLLAAYLRETRPEEALAVCCAALATDPGSFEVHEKMAEVFQDLDRPDEALTAYQIILSRDPSDRRSHRAAARLLMEAGRLSEALDHFEKGGDDEGRKRCRRFLDLEEEWLSHLDDKTRPRDEDLLDLAELCWIKARPAAAARYFAEAARLKLLKPGTKEAHAAARTAALAGCGSHDAITMSEPERKVLRDRALAALRDELAETMKTLTDGGPSSAKTVQATLLRWQRERALAGVRDSDRTGLLADEERSRWEAFWAEVEAVRQLARSRAP